MYKHSVIKRDDGDHITIWVDSGFTTKTEEEKENDGLAKRQRARILDDTIFRNSGGIDWCREHSRTDTASSNGPTSGGVQAMYRWARDHDGYFSFGQSSLEERQSNWKNFIIAGSNGGTNALYRARLRRQAPPNWYEKAVGSEDVGNDADFTQHRQRLVNGKWYASSRGNELCGWPGEGSRRVDYEIIKSNIVA